MKKRLIKNAFLYLLISFVSQCIVFAMWLILGRIMLPADMGRYAMLMFLIDLFTTIAIIGLDAVLTRFYQGNDNRDKVFTNAASIFLVSTLLTVAVFYISPRFMGSFITDSSLMIFIKNNIFVLSIIIVVNTISNLVLAHYSAIKDASNYTKLQILRASLFAIGSVLLFYCFRNLLSILYALIFACLVVFAYFIFSNYKLLEINLISPKTQKDQLAYGIPLMLYSFISVLVMYFGRIMLGKWVGYDTLGVYSFFLVIVLQVNGIWQSINRAWTPEVFTLLRDEPERAMIIMSSTVWLVVFVYLFCYVILIATGNLFVFHVIFASLYFKNIHLLYLLLLGPLFIGIYTVFTPVYYYQKNTKKILFISLAIMAANFFLVCFLVKYYRDVGASLAYLLWSILTLTAYMVTFRKMVNIPKQTYWGITGIVASVLLSSFYLLSEKSVFGFLLLLIPSIIYSFFMSRARLFYLWENIKIKVAGQNGAA